MHHIRKHILKTLMHAKWARFRDMRPPKVDSNVYSYHLRELQKEGLVEKGEHGYRLSPAGLFYVNKISMVNLELRLQPKIITMMVIVNQEGKHLLYPKVKQPFIGKLMLPFGKVHLDDASMEAAARREMQEKVGFVPAVMRHAGDCHIQARILGQPVWNVLAYVFSARIDGDDIPPGILEWRRRSELTAKNTTPATCEVIDAVKDSSTFFFREFDVDW